jgi:hypothetical protein
MAEYRSMYLMKGRALVGTCVESAAGWRFLPANAVRKPSKKAWPSATSCIPSWAMNLADDFLTEWQFEQACNTWEPFGAPRLKPIKAA